MKFKIVLYMDAVIFQEGGKLMMEDAWIGSCLDYNQVSQGKTKEEARQSLVLALSVHFKMLRDKGRSDEEILESLGKSDHCFLEEVELLEDIEIRETEDA